MSTNKIRARGRVSPQGLAILKTVSPVKEVTKGKLHNPFKLEPVFMRRLLDERGMKQKALAEQLGVTGSTISKAIKDNETTAVYEKYCTLLYQATLPKEKYIIVSTKDTEAASKAKTLLNAAGFEAEIVEL